MAVSHLCLTGFETERAKERENCKEEATMGKWGRERRLFGVLMVVQQRDKELYGEGGKQALCTVGSKLRGLMGWLLSWNVPLTAKTRPPTAACCRQVHDGGEARRAEAAAWVLQGGKRGGSPTLSSTSVNNLAPKIPTGAFQSKPIHLSQTRREEMIPPENRNLLRRLAENKFPPSKQNMS